MQLYLDRESRQPLHRQIEQQLRERIQSGDVSVGAHLPATRVLARSLGVNRTTVCTAYDALAAAGYVEPRVGSGTQVVRRHVRDTPDTARPAVAIAAVEHPDWERLFADGGSPAAATAQRDYSGPAASDAVRVDFLGLIPDERLFPVEQLRRAVDVVMRRDGAPLLQYGATRGYEPFLDTLAQRMRLVGARFTSAELLVVNGAQQGLDLLCKAFLDPGDAVVVESPTYGNLLPLLRLHRAEVLPVDMTPTGLDLEQLENLLLRRRPKFLYTMPHFQNPTGITSTLAHRKRLVELAQRHDIVIVEDGYEEDLRWDGGEVLPLCALEHDARVVYVGTFSKGLCPGFRIGWIAAETAVVHRLVHLKRTTDYHTSALSQAALAEFCARGQYDAHLRRLRRTYRARMAAAGRALARHVPQEVRWQLPAGGYSIWLELPPNVSEDELVSRLGRDGVRVAPGRDFFLDDPGHGSVRLSISRVDEEQLEAGIAALGKQVRELARQATKHNGASQRRPYI